MSLKDIACVAQQQQTIAFSFVMDRATQRKPPAPFVIMNWSQFDAAALSPTRRESTRTVSPSVRPRDSFQAKSSSIVSRSAPAQRGSCSLLRSLSSARPVNVFRSGSFNSAVDFERHSGHGHVLDQTLFELHTCYSSIKMIKTKSGFLLNPSSNVGRKAALVSYS